MTTQHGQEKIIESFDYNGVTVDLVEWTDTIWCGKIGYAANNSDEPNMDKIMEEYMSLHHASSTVSEPDWSVCISINYLTDERPNGVMIGSLVATEQQPSDFDVYKIPAAQYMRIRLCDESAKLLGHEPWNGGIPPYQWIGDQIAPQLGYQYGCDTLPIIEYYGYYEPQKDTHKYCYLYVPVKKA